MRAVTEEYSREMQSQNGSKAAGRDASPTRVFLGAEASEGDTSILQAPGWIDEWRRVAERSFGNWEPWELPIGAESLFWKSPRYSAELLAQRYAGQGTAPYLLALLATFPQSSRICREVSDQLFCFHLWDGWLKRYGRQEDFKGLATLFQPGLAAGSGHSHPAAGGGGDRFPHGLERKYPGRRRALVEGLARLFDGRRRAWLPRYHDSWLLYVQGLRMHRELVNDVASGSTPALADFLACKALSGGALLSFVLAAANAEVPALSAAAFRAALPFLAAAATYAAVFGDLYLALRGREDASASLNVVSVYDLDEAVLVHNALLATVSGQREVLLDSRQPSASEAESAARLVEVVQASMHGLVAWHEFPSRFQSQAVRPVPFFARKASPPAAPAWLACQVSAALQRIVASAADLLLGTEGEQAA